MYRNLSPLTSSAPHWISSEHLGEVGAGRWVDWAIGWARGITRLLVETDMASPPAEFIPFDHMSGGRANRQNVITYGFLRKSYYTPSPGQYF